MKATRILSNLSSPQVIVRSLLHLLLAFVVVLGAWQCYKVTRKYYLARQVDRYQTEGEWEAAFQATQQLAEEYRTPETVRLYAVGLVNEANRLYNSGSRDQAFAALDRAIMLNGRNDPSLFESYCFTLIKDKRLEAAEFMLECAAHWQSHNSSMYKPKSMPDLIYHCDGTAYFELARSAINQKKWKLAARALVRWNNAYNHDWVSMPTDIRDKLIHDQLEISLSADDLDRLNHEIDILNLELPAKAASTRE